MPRNRECDYCGTDIEPGTGTMFVRSNGSTIHYCSSKCEKNANLGREARDLEWAEEDEAVEEGAEPEPEPEVETPDEAEDGTEPETPDEAEGEGEPGA
ncbi:MAG: 50S ribosomal protein L24e, partial [Haloarculaceae archaeon]